MNFTKKIYAINTSEIAIEEFIKKEFPHSVFNSQSFMALIENVVYDVNYVTIENLDLKDIKLIQLTLA